MISKLRGIIDSCHNNHITIDVNGVGYLVFCTTSTLKDLTPGSDITLLIETHVRQDHIHLYGFSNNEEKNTFILLQSVKGVGAKMALAILSVLSPEKIKYAIVKKDILSFSTIPGVGKKIAERILIELKEKSITTRISNIFIADSIKKNYSIIADDAISALVSLGIKKTEAQNRVKGLLLQRENISLDELVKLALKN